MRSKANWSIIVLLSIAPMLGAYSNDGRPLEGQESAFCTTGGSIDLDRARKLRELIKDQKSSSEHLLLLKSNLRESISRCSSAINAAHAVFFASMYVDIGAELFSQKEYDEAIRSYREADSLFARFPHPDVLWLQSLRGEALAELAMGNKAAAEHLAGTQVAFARDWVRKQNFIVRELHYALSFETDLCDKSGNTTCSQSSRREAKDLEESARR